MTTPTPQLVKALLAAWLGSLLTACALVAPLAFQVLERAVAGRIAGAVFFWEGWIGLLLFWIVVILINRNKSDRGQGKVRWILLIVSTTFPWVGAVALRPWMERVGGGVDPAMFGLLHGVSMLLFLAALLAAAALLFVLGMEEREGRARSAKI